MNKYQGTAVSFSIDDCVVGGYSDGFIRCF